MKKNYTMRLAGVLLLACTLTLGALSTSLASYRSAAAAGQQYVRVAAFKVLVNGVPIGEATVGSPTRFYTAGLLREGDENEFSENADNSAYNGRDMTGGVRETGAAGEAIIAPGTGGEFKVLVQNMSEVPIVYTLTIGSNLTNDDHIPVEFRSGAVSGGTVTWGAWGSTVNLSGSSGSVLAAGGGSNAADPATVQWRWLFNDTSATGNQVVGKTDGSDTTLGVGGTAAITVPISVTASQLD